jgi:hypothetical protein
MKKVRIFLAFLALGCILGPLPTSAHAQDGFASITGDSFARAVPGDFYLEGNRIPVEKRNAVLLNSPKGKRVVIALIDTTGYSSQIQQRYIGMLITETDLTVCGTTVGVGSYGFGLDRPPAPSNADAHFKIYNQAGDKLGECAAPKDDTLKQPRPLAVVAPKNGPAKLYLGRYAVEIK